MTAKTKSAEDYIGREFIITRVFDAPRELVFKAWTDPRHLAKWWGPKGFTNPVCEWDVRPGGKIYNVMRGPNGSDFPMGGAFQEIVEPERLVLTTGALDDQGNLLFEFLHTVTFGERSGKTTLTVRSKVLRTTADAAPYLGGFEAGMTQSLERLAAYLKSQGEQLVVERVFNAPAAHIWDALTEPTKMKQWYFDLKEFKPEVGFAFEFTVEMGGAAYCHRCRVVEVVPGRKLAYTWRYEGYEGESLVTFELFEAGQQTRLKLTHDGLDSFPKLPIFVRKNFLEGWTKIIGSSLQGYLESTDREIVITREFAAPRELVWQAMTDPRHVVNWWGPRGFSTTIEKMEVRNGGEWKHVMRGPDGTKYPNHSVFKEVVEPERIVFSHGGAKEGGPGIRFLATWTFEAMAAKRTRVTIRMIFPSADERNLVAREFGAIQGGKQTLERLGEHLAKTAVRPFVISRVFAAPRELVWKAWTERESLKRWFGPKGFTMPAAKLDFRPGGVFHYCLCAPDGKEMWGKFVYREIVAPERIVLINSFSDEDGGITRHPFSATWPLEMLSTTTLVEEQGQTRMTIEWVPINATDEERQTFDAMHDSMNQGWSGTFEQLEAYLAKTKA